MVVHTNYRLFGVQLRGRQRGRWISWYSLKYYRRFIICQHFFVVASHQIMSAFLLCDNALDSSVHCGRDHISEPKVARKHCRLPSVSAILISDSLSRVPLLPFWGVEGKQTVHTGRRLAKRLSTWALESKKTSWGSCWKIRGSDCKMRLEDRTLEFLHLQLERRGRCS